MVDGQLALEDVEDRALGVVDLLQARHRATQRLGILQQLVFPQLVVQCNELHLLSVDPFVQLPKTETVHVVHIDIARDVHTEIPEGQLDRVLVRHLVTHRIELPPLGNLAERPARRGRVHVFHGGHDDSLPLALSYVKLLIFIARAFPRWRHGESWVYQGVPRAPLTAFGRTAVSRV